MLRRASVVSGAAVVLLGMGVVPAFADGGWGSVDCSQNPYPGCELSAGKGGRPDTAPRHATPRAPSPNDGGKGGRGSGSGRKAYRDPNLAMCAYERSDYEPPPEVAQAAYHGPAVQGAGVVAAAVVVVRRLGPAGSRWAGEPKPEGKGAWYVYKCTVGGARDAFYRPPVWIPDQLQQLVAAPVPPPAPVDLAQRARKQLRLPSPTIEMSPPGEQLVQLPTWLWLGRSAWRQVSATASVPGVSVRAAARPTEAIWRMGDGSTVTCKGPGTVYTSEPGSGSAAQAERPSPDCGHTYRTSSAGQLGGAYPVSVTVHWTVSWRGAGQSGTFPDLTTTSNAQVRVVESQALNIASHIREEGDR